MTQDTSETNRDFATLFREEAGSLLTEQQIDDEITREQLRDTQAANANIARNRFQGLNLQRYCKDIVRSYQPFFALYLLLSDLTGAASILLPVSCLLWILRKLLVFPLQTAYCVCAIVCVCFYMIQSHAQRKLRVCLETPKADTSSLRKKAVKLRLFSVFASVLLSGLLLFFYYTYVPQTSKFMSLQNIFLWFVGMMFLSGIHNVLYESHSITFFAIGWYMVTGQKNRTADAVRHYTQTRAGGSLRSHLVTIRIYLLIALFILCILDFICIRQCLIHFDYAVLGLGIASILCTLLCMICLISCIRLFKHNSAK